MLVLSRKAGEKILIGNNITITVVEIRGKKGKVRIGIEAPAGVSVDREEVRTAKVRDGVPIGDGSTSEIPRAALHPEHRRPLEKAEYAAMKDANAKTVTARTGTEPGE